MTNSHSANNITSSKLDVSNNNNNNNNVSQGEFLTINNNQYNASGVGNNATTFQ